MSILILAAPLTGRSWLVGKLQDHGIMAVDLDRIMDDTIREFGFEYTDLPVVGLPKWFERVKIAALEQVPTNADVYIGGSAVFPFLPNGLINSLTLFLEVPDLKLAYRRALLPYLPDKNHQNLPVEVLAMIVSAYSTDKPIPFYENFKSQYTKLRQRKSIPMTANEIIDHLCHVFS